MYYVLVSRCWTSYPHNGEQAGTCWPAGMGSDKLTSDQGATCPDCISPNLHAQFRDEWDVHNQVWRFPRSRRNRLYQLISLLLRNLGWPTQVVRYILIQCHAMNHILKSVYPGTSHTCETAAGDTGRNSYCTFIGCSPSRPDGGRSTQTRMHIWLCSRTRTVFDPAIGKYDTVKQELVVCRTLKQMVLAPIPRLSRCSFWIDRKRRHCVIRYLLATTNRATKEIKRCPHYVPLNLTRGGIARLW